MSRPRVSPEQLGKLLEFMEDNRELAIGRDRYTENDNQKSIGTRFQTSSLWSSLTEILNSVEKGVKRSPMKWCRYWADVKYKAKKRAQSLHKGEKLTDVEERIIRLVGVETKSYKLTCDSAQSDEDQKPILNEDSLHIPASPIDQVNPIEQVNLSQGFNQTLSTEEILAEAAMRSALAAERQAEAVVQGVELFRDFMTTFREDIVCMQNIAQSLLERDRNVQ